MPPLKPSQFRRLVRYRYMFRFALTMFVIGVLSVSVGALVWVSSGQMPAALLWGLIVMELAGLSAYKVVLSTARILDRWERCTHA